MLVFGGSAEVVWHSYYHGQNDSLRNKESVLWNNRWTLLISGAFVLSLAIIYSIVVCLIVPIMKKRKQRAQRIDVQELDTVSVEGIMQTWLESSSSQVVQEGQDVTDSSHTMQNR